MIFEIVIKNLRYSKLKNKNVNKMNGHKMDKL